MITVKPDRGYNAPPQTIVRALQVLDKRAFDAAKKRLIFRFLGVLLEERTDAERAEYLVKRAREIGLTDKTSLSGHTLNSWAYESVPPTWAVKTALAILRERQWSLPPGEEDVAALIQYLDSRSM